jgi:hypothetical protein
LTWCAVQHPHLSGTYLPPCWISTNHAHNGRDSLYHTTFIHACIESMVMPHSIRAFTNGDANVYIYCGLHPLHHQLSFPYF